MKPEIIAIAISVMGFLVSCFGVFIAYLAYNRDTSKLVIKPSITYSSNKDEAPIASLTIKIINCGRRKDKLKVLVLKAPGHSPTLSYFYYIDAEGVANKIVNEAEDISVSVPITPFTLEAIQRCKDIYLVNSADEVLKAKRKSIRKLKNYVQHVEPVEIEDKDQWKVFRIKSPSRFFSVLAGEEYTNVHFHVDESENV